MRRTILIAILATLVGATLVVIELRSPEPTVARYTVAEYRADTPMRRQALAECSNDPGTLGQSPDCINAREAERQESRRSLRDQAPIGLNPNGTR